MNRRVCSGGLEAAGPIVLDGAMAHGENQDLFTLAGEAQSDPSFDLVLRGYDRRQVDRFVAQLDAEVAGFAARRDEAIAQAQALAAQLTDLQNQMGELRRHVSVEKPSYKHLGARVEQIFGLIEEEAASVRGGAEADARKVMQAARADADALRAQAERALTDRHAAVEQEYAAKTKEADRLVADAEKRANALRRESEQLRAEVDKQAASLRERTKTEVRQAQEDANQYAARIRGEAEKHAKKVLTEADEHAARVRSKADEAARETADLSRRQSERTLATARSEAEAVRAKARAEAERTVADAEHAVRQLTERRGQIKQQINRLREAVAQLTGGTADLLADEDENAQPAASRPRGAVPDAQPALVKPGPAGSGPPVPKQGVAATPGPGEAGERNAHAGGRPRPDRGRP
jgi:cell division septum initiation protein DivIVA